MQNPQGLKSQSRLRAQLLTCSAALALIASCAFTTTASAQTPATSADEGSTVVVTGIRRGIQDAISAKKKSSSIVESISAEDIGKLPDASIAESIARLPGIAAQRTNGRASALSVRGLGPDYTVTTLNGREQVSTSDNRSVEFDQFPSELISQVLVYKTPDASMMSQGIAGTADLRTVRPLAYGKRAIALGYRKEQNSNEAAVGGSSNTGDRYSFTYIDQFMDKTVGFAFGYAHTSSPYQATRKEAWGYPDLSAGVKVIGGEKDAVQSANLERDGYMAVVEFKPNDRLRMTFDAYHSDFNELQQIARLEYPLQWSSASLQPGYTVANGFVNHGVFTGVKTVVENYVSQRAAKVDSLGWNTEYNLNDNWLLTADLSSSKVVRDDVQVESTAGTGQGGVGATDTITFDQTGNGLTNLQGVLNYSSFANIYLTDPGGWGGPANRAGFVKKPHIEDELTTIKLSATRKLDNPIFKSVTFGVNQTKRTKDKKGIEGFLSLRTGPTEVVPTGFRRGTTNANFLGSSNGMIAYDALGLYESGYFIFTQDNCSDCIKKTWNVDETVDIFFVKADIDSTFIGIPVTGNIGVQSQKATQTATSVYSGTGGNSTVKDGTSYTNILPSVNLNFTLADDLQLRVGLGKTLVRPRMDDMAAGTSYGAKANSEPPVIFNGQTLYWSGGGGNPNLKPWEATAFDLSIEKYFGKKGYVSAAVFYKDLTSFIFNKTQLFDYSAVSLSPFQQASGNYTSALANHMGTLSSQANGNGGWIKGLEITASIPGELLLPALDGFGLIASAAFNESEVNPTGTNAVDLPGLSRTVINTTIYYEKYGFSARVSRRYRGDFLGEVPNFANSLENKWVHNESVVDAQIGYAFEDGPAKGLSLNLTGTNLTDEPFFTYDGKGHPERVLKYEKFGATYMFGLNYKF